MAQHLMGVEACGRICRGRIENGKVGSRELTFFPGGSIYGGHYDFDIGTAGSTVLLLSVVLPIAIFSEGSSTFHVTGGLFQDFAPSAYYFKYVLLPVLHRMGLDAKVDIVRPGYYPKGAGSVRVTIAPIERTLAPLSLLEQGDILNIEGIALSSLLEERKVSHRMAQACQERLLSAGYNAAIEAIYDTKKMPAFRQVSIQPGACLAVWAQTKQGCLLGSDMAGAQRRTAESIGTHVAENLIEDLQNGATVDRFLADQLIPFCALAEGTSEYLIPQLTEHVETRLWLVEKMLGAKTQVKDNRVTITGIGYRR